MFKEDYFNDYTELIEAGMTPEDILYDISGWFGTGAMRDAVRDIARVNDLIEY